MSNTKIVIDKDDFEQKIIGWIERRNYISKDNLLSLFQDLFTEIQIDQSIEEKTERIEKLIVDWLKSDNENATYIANKIATQQQIIEQMKAKENPLLKLIGFKIKFIKNDYATKAGEGVMMLTTKDYNNLTNKK